jgi:hypothetical protein
VRVEDYLFLASSSVYLGLAASGLATEEQLVEIIALTYY